jgi:hypothetical protein
MYWEIWLGLCVLATIGCENTVDTSPNKLCEGVDVQVCNEATDSNDATDMTDGTASSDGTDGTNGTESVDATDGATEPDGDGGECAECIKVGAWYRFVRIRDITADGASDAVAEILETNWAGDIERFELNVLMEVTESNENGVSFRVSNGLRLGTEGDFCVVDNPKADMTMPYDKGGLGDSNEISLSIFAGSPTAPKNCNIDGGIHAIGLSKITATAGCNEGCDLPTEVGVFNLTGQIDGSFGEKAINTTCSCIALEGFSDDKCGVLDPSYENEKCPGCNSKFQSLKDLLLLFNANEDLDYSGCTDNEGLPAACLNATFDANLLSASPAPCP